MKKNIVLTGFMGVGKTVVGQRAARFLKMNFMDTDNEIEKRLDMTISDIFIKYGEQEFRNNEKKLALELAETENTVIATGGGMVNSPENMENLKKNGIIINLYCGVDKIINNIGDASSRPLVYKKTRQEILALMKEREVLYRNANVRIDVTKLNEEQAATEIAKIYREREVLNG